MHSVLYPGSFDPVTVGHLDIITRAASLFDRVVVAVLHNPDKQCGMFSVGERVALLRIVTADLHTIEVCDFPGLLVDAARAFGVDAVVRGVRSSDDANVELQMARLNRQIGGVETLFLAASPEVSHISASFVSQIGCLGGTLRGLVPEPARARIEKAFRIAASTE